MNLLVKDVNADHKLDTQTWGTGKEYRETTDMGGGGGCVNELNLRKLTQEEKTGNTERTK